MIHSRGSRRAALLRAAAWIGPLLVVEASLVGLALAGDLRARPGRFLALYGAAFVAYAAAVAGARALPGGRRGLLVVLAAALLFRVTLVPSSPTLSDDVYRYLWDGRVQRAGTNPYLHPPDHPALADLRDDSWERINHREIPTIYPPLMQIVFRVGATIAPSVVGFKLLFLLFELGVMWIVWRLALLAGGGARNVAIYAWNPLVILEVAGSGHNDVIAVMFLMAALLFIIQDRPGLSTLSLGASILAKFVPVMVLPTFVRRTPASRVWLLPAILAAGYLPFAVAGKALFRGLSEYGRRWEHNDFLFRGLLEVTFWLDPSGPLKALLNRLDALLGGAGTLSFLYYYTHPQYVARIVAFGAMGAVAIYVTFKPWAPSRELLVVLAAVLLLSPTVHPWYLLWIVPLLAIHPCRGLLLWTGLAALSYAFPPGRGDAPYAGPLLFAEYLPVVVVLLVEVVIFSRKPRWMPFGLPARGAAGRGEHVDRRPGPTGGGA